MKNFLLLLTLCASCLFQVNAETVITENFNLFTAGSDTAPDSNYMEGDISSYTQTPGWYASYVQQAGGCAYFPVSSSLYTPVIDVSGNGGSYVITFKAKSDSQPGMILLSDQYFSSYDFRELTSEWQEYSITLTNGSPATQVAFSAMYSDFYLDDVVISDGGVDVPVAIESSNFTRDSFTANWIAVNGATSYLLDVYTYVYNTQTTVFEPQYLFKDKEVTGTSHVVTEGEYDIPYYYEVAAKNGNSISKKSNRVTVTPLPEEVEVPVAYSANNISNGSFTASWSESSIATKYYLHVIKQHTAPSDEVYTFADYDFSEFTDGTLDAPHKEMEYLYKGDWASSVAIMANGCIGVNNEDMSLFGQSVIASPLIQTSKGNNQITIKFNAIARMGMEKGAVQLVKYDENNAPIAIVDRGINLSETEWNEYSITFDDVNCASASILITSSEAGRMFIDNLKATISLSAEEEITLPIITYDVTELNHTATKIDITKDDEIYYYVNGSWAVRQQEGVVRQIPEVVSEASNIVKVEGLFAGIEDATTDLQSTVIVSENTIIIENPNNAKVSVLSIDGKLIFANNGTALQCTFNVNTPGVYIVIVGNEFHKVIVK